jgi:acetoin utilization deacetylase AcuC-like enzyme
MSVPLSEISVFFSSTMVADSESFSPSASKPAAMVESWLKLGVPIAVREPQPATREDLIRAHDPAYVDGILTGRLKNGFGNTSAAVAASLPFTTGAMLSAAREALRNGRVAVAPCSGFHHADYSHAAGFCTFNGLVVSAAALRANGEANRVGILDFDQHYGDGTDEIIDHLGIDWITHYTAGGSYWSRDQALTFLGEIAAIVESMRYCDVILYQAGADPHVDDPLGGWLTTKQLFERDRLVFRAAKTAGIPIAWNLAGGYQSPLRKVLDIHDNTMRACVAEFLFDRTV